MKQFCLVLGTFALILGTLTAPAAAHADTYQIFNLGSDLNRSVFGITDSGTAVIALHVPVGAPECAISHICTEYETWVNGVMVNESATVPNLVYDNGTACAPTASFPILSTDPGVCNNGHEVYSANVSIPAFPAPAGTFTGPDLTDVFAFAPLSVDEVNLNSSGDFVYDLSHPTEGQNGGELLEAIDLTTDQVPEPASILLLSTGLFAAMGTMRRRLFQVKAP